MKPDWLGRQWIVGPFLRLVLSEAEFLATITDLDGTPLGVGRWAAANGATTHFFDHEGGQTVAVVSINVTDQSGIQIAALLCHEAVHVFQQHCKDIGEKAPSAEFEAYSIQYIAQQLMLEYARRMK